MKEIRLGTIGSGVIVKALLNQVAKTDGVRLTAVYSRSYDRAAELAAAYGASRVFTDPEAFFQNPEMDCVYIASPNSLHYPQTKAALLAGKHVWCEKPFCTTAEQARELFDIARERNLMLAEAVPTAFYPNLQILRQHLPDIGRLRLVQGNYSQYSSRYDALREGKPLPNVFSPEFGGGCLVDINYYNVAFAVSLFGEPVKAHYAANKFGPIDTSGVVLLEYPDFVCQCTGAKDTWGENIVQLQGEDGYIVITGGSNGLTGIRLVTREGEEFSGEAAPFGRWREEMAALCRIVQSGDRADCERRMEWTLATMRTIDRLRADAGIVFAADKQ